MLCNNWMKISTFVFLAAVAAAAKTWQKFKGPEQIGNSEQAAEASLVDHSEQQDVCSSSSAVASRAPATMHTGPDPSQPSPCGAVRDTTGDGGNSIGNSHAAVQSGGASPSHAVGLQLTDSSRSSVVGGQPSHRVEFARSEADAAAGGAAVVQHGGDEAEEGLEAEQQASAADLRARVAAHMRR